MLTEEKKKEIIEEVRLLTEVDDCVGIEIGKGKALFFQVVDYGDGMEYIIELNDVVDGTFEPCAKYNASAPFGDTETLISVVEWYLERETKKKEKKKKIDFVLSEGRDEILIFRFYPRSSSCHSFGCLPPTKWEEVYKVYYSYSVIQKWKENGSYRKVFECDCDECSIIDEVAARCLYLSEGKENVTKTVDGKEHTINLLNNEMYPSGMGVSWDVTKVSGDYYEFRMFDWNDVGFRFALKKDRLKEFGEYLQECCEHMLEHGDPI